MFDWAKNLFGGGSAAEKKRQNPVVAVAVQQSAVVYSEIPLHQFIDKSRHSELARRLFLEINRLCNSREPAVACRERFTECMLQLAAYQVLVIPPPPAEDRSALRAQPGVSGQLGEHLTALFEKNDELRSAYFRDGGDQEVPDYWNFAQRRFWELYWELETLDAARLAIGDATPPDDWKIPFLHAACVDREHHYRWQLDLSPAFDAGIAREAAEAYSVFTDIVVSGTQNPAFEWREYYRGSGIPMPDFAA